MSRYNRRHALAIAGAVATTTLFGCAGLPRPSPSHADDGRPWRYAYGDDPSQYAEISLPAGSAPAAVVVILHGGFWLDGFGLELGRPLAADLARRGFAAVNVEYRRVGGGGGWPQTGHDVAAAVGALKVDGQRLTDQRLDLSRVVALGHSAGGQLAAWLGARRSAAVPLIGVVSQAGVLDLVSAADHGLGGDAVADFMGGAPAQVPQAYADASPAAQVPLGVPSICVHGQADTVVPIEQSARFVAAATRAGDRSELRVFDGDHFAPISVGNPAWELSVRALTDLLH